MKKEPLDTKSQYPGRPHVLPDSVAVLIGMGNFGAVMQPEALGTPPGRRVMAFKVAEKSRRHPSNQLKSFQTLKAMPPPSPSDPFREKN